MSRKLIPLKDVEKTFGCIPAPESFDNNLQRLTPLQVLYNNTFPKEKIEITDIIGVNIGKIENDDFIPLKSDDMPYHHIDDLQMAIYLRDESPDL